MPLFNNGGAEDNENNEDDNGGDHGLGFIGWVVIWKRFWRIRLGTRRNDARG